MVSSREGVRGHFALYKCVNSGDGNNFASFAKKKGFEVFCDALASFSRFSDVFGPVWTCSDLFGCVRMHSDASGRVRMRLDASGKISIFSQNGSNFFGFGDLLRGFGVQFGCCFV